MRELQPRSNRDGKASALALPSTPESPHIAPMPAPRKSASGPKSSGPKSSGPKSSGPKSSGPKSKASRPEVYPLGEHLAELLNPALVEPKSQGFGEAPH